MRESRGEGVGRWMKKVSPSRLVSSRVMCLLQEAERFIVLRRHHPFVLIRGASRFPSRVSRLVGRLVACLSSVSSPPLLVSSGVLFYSSRQASRFPRLPFAICLRHLPSPSVPPFSCFVDDGA